MIRTRLSHALKDAVEAGDKDRACTLRLIAAAIKERDIAVDGEEPQSGISDADMRAVLLTMVRQRKDSARDYEEAGRLELAEKERAEIEIIREFLPKPLSDKEMDAAISAAIKRTGAESIRDVGRVMAALKSDVGPRADISKLGNRVKAALG